MSKLRDSARMKQCTVRLPCCNFDPETTVLAHFRMAGDGISRKPNDTRAAYACSACHDCVDARVTLVGYSNSDIRQAFADAVFRTQDIMIKEGLIVIDSKMEHTT